MVKTKCYEYECDHGTFCSERCYENWHNQNIVGKPDCYLMANDGIPSDDRCAECNAEIPMPVE